MDSLARLIFAMALSLLPQWALAYEEINVQSGYTYTCTANYNVNSTQTGYTAAAACLPLIQAYAGTFVYQAKYNAVRTVVPGACGTASIANCAYTYTVKYTCIQTAGCSAIADTVVTTSMQVVRGAAVYYCGNGATGVGSGAAMKCYCPIGSKPSTDGSKCDQYTCPPSGSYSAVTTPDVLVPNAGDETCTAGCAYKPSAWKSGADGKIWGTWPFKSTGSFCEGEKKPGSEGTTGEKNTNPAPIPCGVNMCPGTVNGANVCVACKDTTVPGPSEAASAADGSTTETKTETKCTQSVCTTTTTTTTKDSSGTVTGTTTKTEEQGQKSFCAENPDASVCKSGTFGGACGAFTCDGDGVQCALALEVHKRNCEWAEVDSGLKTIGTSALSGELKPAGHPGAEGTSQSMAFSSVIDQTERVGSGCPADVSIAYGGRSWVIPWSQHCDKLQLIGNLMVGICMLAAAVIVFRG